MTNSDLVGRTIAAWVLIVVVAVLAVWLAWAWVRSRLDAYAAGIHWRDHGQHQVRNQLAHMRAQADKRKGLEEFGLTDRELRMNHTVIRDPKTGMPTTIYHISPARMEALAAALMHRYIQAFTAESSPSDEQGAA